MLYLWGMNNNNTHTMKNFPIGTKVNYFHKSTINNCTSKISKVIGHEFDGRFNYVVLENGDKMFRQALSIHMEPIVQRSQEIETLKKKLESPMFDGFNNENLKHYLEQKIIDLSK